MTTNVFGKSLREFDHGPYRPLWETHIDRLVWELEEAAWILLNIEPSRVEEYFDTWRNLEWEEKLRSAHVTIFAKMRDAARAGDLKAFCEPQFLGSPKYFARQDRILGFFSSWMPHHVPEGLTNPEKLSWLRAQEKDVAVENLISANDERKQNKAYEYSVYANAFEEYMKIHPGITRAEACREVSNGMETSAKTIERAAKKIGVWLR